MKFKRGDRIVVWVDGSEREATFFKKVRGSDTQVEVNVHGDQGGIYRMNIFNVRRVDP